MNLDLEFIFLFQTGFFVVHIESLTLICGVSETHLPAEGVHESVCRLIG